MTSKSLIVVCSLIAVQLLPTSSNGEEPTNRDSAIQYLADLVGAECKQEDIDKLKISKEQCDQRLRDSVVRCKSIAATDLPAMLSQVELGRAMLRFSLCRGVLMQGATFDLKVWEPTITKMLEEAHQSED